MFDFAINSPIKDLNSVRKGKKIQSKEKLIQKTTVYDEILPIKR